jgi:hypothetical protein
MPPGPALLSLRTGAPLYTATLWFEPDRACARLAGPVDPPAAGPLDLRVRQLTQRVADGLAAGIAEHPEDWHMLQRLWTSSTPGGSAVADPSRGAADPLPEGSGAADPSPGAADPLPDGSGAADPSPGAADPSTGTSAGTGRL